ncbi:recombinase family protein [Nocardia sp. IBHARD005]|uniref:recombinase family protein n=1 Tax=Nocardia sp. IBHARD005 TaxID=3457765 RepID=UPI004059E912
MQLDWSHIEAIILARVSDDRDGSSDSTEEQVDESVAWCAERGVNIIETLIEDDIGASRYSRKARPNYERAMELLRQKSTKQRMLITWESSRSTRQLKWHIKLRETLEEAGALWMYGGRIYDMRDPDDRKRTAQDAIEDEYEVEKTRKRVMRDMRKVAADGRPHGKVPYGYKIIRDERTGKSIGREIFKEHAVVVRDIARRILAGESVHSITVRLNEAGIAAPRPARTGPNKGNPGRWRSNTIGTLITSPTYAALRVTRGEVTGPATWPAILTIDEHERLKTILNDSSRVTHRGVTPVWLLTAPVGLCGECGGGLVIRRGQIDKSGQPGKGLTCGDNFCTAALVRPVEKLVERAVLDRLESPDVLKLLTVGDEVAAAAFDEERALQARLDSLIDQAADGSISPATLARLEGKLMPQIASAKRRARAAIPSPLVAELAGPQAGAKWEELAMTDRRSVVRALVEVRLFRGGVGTRVLNPRRVHLRWVGSDEPVPTKLPPPVPLAEGGDPIDFRVREVQAYLQTADLEERVRIIELERDGQKRYDIVRRSLSPTRAVIFSDGS